METKKNRNYVYSLITIRNRKGEEDSSRCWGMFGDVAQIITEMEQNPKMFYNNGYYDFVLIERVPFGLDEGQRRKQWWYEFRYQDLDIVIRRTKERPIGATRMTRWAVG